jgi:hypothetical protein
LIRDVNLGLSQSGVQHFLPSGESENFDSVCAENLRNEIAGRRLQRAHGLEEETRQDGGREED